MNPENQARRAKWRETSAAGLVAGLLILLLISFGILVAIIVAPIADKLPAPEATVPDGAEGDAFIPQAKGFF
jgi:uncharacterized iron-regulated membrane protein